MAETQRAQCHMRSGTKRPIAEFKQVFQEQMTAFRLRTLAAKLHCLGQ